MEVLVAAVRVLMIVVLVSVLRGLWKRLRRVPLRVDRVKVDQERTVRRGHDRLGVE